VKQSEFFELDELHNLPWIDAIRHRIEDDSVGVEISEQLNINSVVYRKGSFVVLNSSEQGFLFGKIVCIVRDDPLVPLLVLIIYPTISFDQNLYCYKVAESNPADFHVVDVSQLLDYHPLDGVNICGGVYIRMKYYVMGK